MYIQFVIAFFFGKEIGGKADRKNLSFHTKKATHKMLTKLTHIQRKQNENEKAFLRNHCNCNQVKNGRRW
jgi:hypothetical protein